MTKHVLRIDGDVENPLSLSFADLESLGGAFQVRDVSRIDPNRKGDAVSLV
jgi:DMSO/TMAO reductase YedYZ molybdopterin-dependent catalytic subunit